MAPYVVVAADSAHHLAGITNGARRRKGNAVVGLISPPLLLKV